MAASIKEGSRLGELWTDAMGDGRRSEMIVGGPLPCNGGRASKCVVAAIVIIQADMQVVGHTDRHSFPRSPGSVVVLERCETGEAGKRRQLIVSRKRSLVEAAAEDGGLPTAFEQVKVGVKDCPHSAVSLISGGALTSWSAESLWSCLLYSPFSIPVLVITVV